MRQFRAPRWLPGGQTGEQGGAQQVDAAPALAARPAGRQPGRQGRHCRR